MKIVYFGSDVFLDVFEYLHLNHEILALYTYHMEEDDFNEHNIVQLAHMSGIPVCYGQITEDEMLSYMEKEGCELFFVAEYSHKIPVPDDSRFYGVNIHSSLLPEGRSYYPVECAMERGLGRCGVTMHKIAKSLDRGDILAQRKYDIQPGNDSVDIYLKSGRQALSMVKELMEDFDRVWSNARPQKEKLPYWNRPKKEALALNHSMTVEEARGVYRCFNKMTTVCIDGRSCYVDGFAAGSVLLGQDDSHNLFVRENRVLYGVADGHLRLDLVPVWEE